MFIQQQQGDARQRPNAILALARTASQMQATDTAQQRPAPQVYVEGEYRSPFASREA